MNIFCFFNLKLYFDACEIISNDLNLFNSIVTYSNLVLKEKVK